MFDRVLAAIERETYLRRLLYWIALMFAILVGLQNCTQPQRLVTAQETAVRLGTPATLIAHNTMRVDVDVYAARAGFADLYLGTLRPFQRDTFTMRIPAGSAYTYRVQNAYDWRWRAETYVIFIRSEPVVFSWVIRTPLGMQPPEPRRAK